MIQIKPYLLQDGHGLENTVISFDQEIMFR